MMSCFRNSSSQLGIVADVRKLLIQFFLFLLCFTSPFFCSFPCEIGTDLLEERIILEVKRPPTFQKVVADDVVLFELRPIFFRETSLKCVFSSDVSFFVEFSELLDGEDLGSSRESRIGRLWWGIFQLD